MQRYQETVDAIFEFAGDRRNMIDPNRPATAVIERMAHVLEPSLGKEHAREVAFHLSDWSADAAFLVALHLFPEMFDDEMTLDGLMGAVVHAPNHMAAAARLAGFPVHDSFKIERNQVEGS